MSKSILKDKSYAFAVAIVKLYQKIQNNHKEYAVSSQIVRSGTAVGALIMEAEFGQSKADFIHKLSIALKEANETKYWISILYDAEYINKDDFEKYTADSKELVAILVASIKTLKSKGN